MHKSWGNAIDLNDALERMGADVMRWRLLLAEPRPGAALRLRARRGGQAALPHLLELGQVLRRLREHRRVPAGVVASSSPRRAGAARPLARRAHARLRPRGAGGVRGVRHGRRDAGLRGVSRRSLELVHPPLAAPLLGRRRGRVADALVRARADAARARADPAVRHRPPVADARPRRAGVGAPRRLAGGRRAGSRLCSTRSPRCGASSSSAGRRARPRASSCGSRCAGSSSRARASTAMSRRSRTSCA